MKNQKTNSEIQNRINELIWKIQSSEPTSIEGNTHIHNVHQILTEEEMKELSYLCEMEDLLENLEISK